MPILLFNIKSNLHNKQLVRYKMNMAEDLESLALEQYDIGATKYINIHALNT